MHLLQLPVELLDNVLCRLTKPDVLHLCLTCIEAYHTCLPTLYKHVHLKQPYHIRQLTQGVLRSSVLKRTLEKSTQLTIDCTYSSGRSLVPVTRLLPWIPLVKKLVLNDFALNVETIFRIVHRLPRLTHLVLRYCTVSVPDGTQESPLPVSLRATVTRLDLVWTDFSSQAMDNLLQGLPHLTHADFGANRNRTDHANDAAVDSLLRHCPHISHLAIALQQVKESTLCNVIATYGPQLRSLSIRCEGPQTLTAVAAHATQVHYLTIRASGAWLRKSPSSPSPSVMPSTPSSSIAHTSLHQDEDATDENCLIRLFRQCRALGRLEVACWTMQDIPTIVWNAVDAVSQRRGKSSMDVNVISTPSTPKTDRDTDTQLTQHDLWLYHLDEDAPRELTPTVQPSSKQHLSKTLALGMEELSEIRKHVHDTTY